MRAVSLWEPWGTAIAKGLKRIETRSWPTSYRGPLAIHCAKNRTAIDYIFYPSVQAAFAEAGVRSHEDLTFGAVVAVAELVSVHRTEVVDARVNVSALEIALGDYTPGRFGWVLENVRPLKTPVPFRGAQGLFEVPDELLKEVEG